MVKTKQAMLEAGVRLYGCRSDELLRGLKAGSVAETAGFHRQTFYRYWDTQAEYVRDLVAWLMNPRQGPGRSAAGASGVPRGAPADIEAFVRDMADRALPRWRSDDLVRMRISLLMIGVLREPSSREHTSTYHLAAIGALAEAYEHLLGSWGLELVDGVSSRAVARAIAIQLVGFAILAESAGDDPPTAAGFERSTAVLLRAWARPREDGTPELNRQGGRSRDGRETTSVVEPKPDTRDLLLGAGAQLYRELAVELLGGLSAGMVAGEAGVTRQTFYRYWDTHDEYIHDLLDWLFSPGEGPRATRPDDMRVRRLPAGDIETFVRDLIHYDLPRLAHDGYSRMRLGLVMAGGGDGTVGELARQYYNESRALLASVIGGLLDECGREPIEGQSAVTLASVVQAQLFGSLLVMDTTADEEPSVDVVVQRMLVTVLGSLTRPASGVSEVADGCGPAGAATA